MSITAFYQDWRNRQAKDEGQGINPEVMPEQPEEGSFADQAQKSQAFNMAPRADGSKPDLQNPPTGVTAPPATATATDDQVPSVMLDPDDNQSQTQPTTNPWYDLGILDKYKPELNVERAEGHQKAARAKLLGDAIREVVQGVYASKGGSIPAYDRQPVQDSLGKYGKMLDDHEGAEYQHKLKELQLLLKNIDAEKEGNKRREAWQREDGRRDDDKADAEALRKENQEREDQIRAENNAYRAERDKVDDKFKQQGQNIQWANTNKPSAAQARADTPHRTIYDRNDRNKVLANLNQDQAHQLEQIILDHLAKEFEQGNLDNQRLGEQLKNRAAIHPNDRWDMVLEYFDKVPQAMEYLYQQGNSVEMPDRRQPMPDWMTPQQYQSDPRIAEKYLPPANYQVERSQKPPSGERQQSPDTSHKTRQANQQLAPNGQPQIQADDFIAAWKAENPDWPKDFPDQGDAQILQTLIKENPELLDYIY